jgi:hypothetical protein
MTHFLGIVNLLCENPGVANIVGSPFGLVHLSPGGAFMLLEAASAAPDMAEFAI